MQVSSNLDNLREYNKVAIVLTSADKTAGAESNTRFSIPFTSTSQALSRIKKIGVSSYSSNNLFYNVASYNNKFELIWYEEGVGPTFYQLITIPVGYYNATELAAIIQDTVVASVPALPNFTCVFDLITLRFTFDGGDPLYTISLSPAVTNNAFSSRQEGTLAYNLGFLLPYPAGLTITAQNIPNLNIQNVFIYSMRLANQKAYRSNANDKSVLTNFLLSVPLAIAPYGGIVSYVSTGLNERGTVYYNTEQQLDTIDILLLNEYGNQLELPINANVNIEFMIYY
jgi:hypothetical protein